MAYCPKCENNYPIVVSTSGSSYSVPVTTERYSSTGEYIGYEESEEYAVDIETLPRCSNCYSVFKFPNATSKEEFFYAKGADLIRKWREKPPPNDLGDFIWVPILVGIVVGFVLFGIFVFSGIGVEEKITYQRFGFASVPRTEYSYSPVVKAVAIGGGRCFCYVFCYIYKMGDGREQRALQKSKTKGR